jgi:ribosomal protein S18 acetylase RimI-like enzyme
MPLPSDELHIVRASSERIADLEPLWKALQHHHAMVAPHFGPVRSPEESWERRRLRYQRLLNQPGPFVLIAEQAARVVGYALVAMQEGSDTWQTPDQVAELETLSVLPDVRGAGIGSALVHAVFEELGQAGISDITVEVIASNQDALRFYQRHGLTPKALLLHESIGEGADSRRRSRA